MTAVWASDAEHEALRDLRRAREAARTAQRQARQQRLALWLRLGVEEPGETRRWTQRYRSWLGEVSLEQPRQRLVLADALEAVDVATARLARLETEPAPDGSMPCGGPVRLVSGPRISGRSPVVTRASSPLLGGWSTPPGSPTPYDTPP